MTGRYTRWSIVPLPLCAILGTAFCTGVCIAASALMGTTPSVQAQTAPVRYRDPVFQRVDRTVDLVYGQTTDIPTGRPVELLLDLYEPGGDTESARPVLLFVHGGGFTGGDKSAGQRWAMEFARRGWVAVSISYRLKQGDLYTVGIPAAVSDSRQALRWLRREAATHRLDTDRVVAAGSSAGAITALFMSYTDMEKGPDDKASAVAGVMDLWGAMFGQENEMVAGDPPLVIVHGTEDTTVPYRYAEALRDRAEEVGVPFDFRPLEGVGHGSGQTAQISAWTAEFFHPLLWPSSATPTGAPSSEATATTLTTTPTTTPTTTLTKAPTTAPASGWSVLLPLVIRGSGGLELCQAAHVSTHHRRPSPLDAR